MNGEFAANGNVRTPVKSGLATISERESCTGTKNLDDANMAEASIKPLLATTSLVASAFLILRDLLGNY
jgi:hypothetical protein